MTLRCFLFGHHPMLLDALRRGPLLTVKDALDSSLVEVWFCERSGCGDLYHVPPGTYPAKGEESR